MSQAMAKPDGSMPATSPDFWDVSGAADTSAHWSPDHEFRNMSDQSRIRQIVVAVLLVTLALVGYAVYETLVNGKDPIGDLIRSATTFYDELTGAAPPIDEVPPEAVPQRAARPKFKQAPPKEVPKTKTDLSVAGNPYWSLPNKYAGAPTDMGRAWTAEDEELFRAGLLHKFSYQHYKTVMEIRQRRLKGSEAILWDAAEDKKFWTRMFALVGIAEFNVPVTLPILDKALQGNRSELIANFFERFVKKPNPGQLYLMRQSIRLLDERGRLVILRAIHRSNDELRDLYMVAATQDPGKHIKKWLAQALAERPVDPAHYDELLDIVTGYADPASLLGTDSDGDPAAKVQKEQTEEPLEGAFATEADLDEMVPAEATEADGEGDVEFYEEVPPPAPVDTTDPVDPKTLEYDQ